MPLAFDRLPISGKEGKITAVINGNVVELAEIKTLNASIAFNKTEYNALGIRAVLHKPGAWTGTGSVTYHWGTPRFSKMAIDAAKSGKLPVMTINVTNDDPSSSAGRQTVKLGQVTMDGADIANIDVDNEMLEGSFDFTFSEVDGLEYFNDI